MSAELAAAIVIILAIFAALILGWLMGGTDA